MKRKETASRRVLIIQSELKHYRLPFFTGLYDALRSDGIELKVAYSNSNTAQAIRNDSADLGPPIGFKVKGWWFFGRFIYQPLWREVLCADLVIIGPEIKYLLNPALLTMSRLNLKTIAFWGLGPNKHPGRSAQAEWIKQHFFTSVNWWFPYTESVADYLRAKGMPPERTTVVQNATDTAQLRKFMEKIPNEEVCSAKEALTGSYDAVVGLYCGLIGGIKQLPFLLAAARLVKRVCPQFHLVVIGDGPDRLWLESAISKEPWIHYLGFKNHERGALYYRMASVFLLAGTAGLAVVDSFAAGLPIVVTDLPTHPPEISYVVHGLNGLITEHNIEAFSKGIIEVLSDGPLMETLRKGALQAGVKYSMETMVQNYRTGIMQCLAQKSNLMQARNVAQGAGRLWI